MTADQQPRANGIDADALTETIITAVERQITRYFAAMSQQAESARQTAEAAHQALEEQIPIIGAAIDAQREANETYQQALQSALEERLSEFANHQHWRLNEIEDRVAQLPEQLALQLPIAAAPTPGDGGFASAGPALSAEDLLEIRQTVRDDTEQTLATVHAHVEELLAGQRRVDEQSTALVQHVNDTTAALAQRMDDGDQRIAEAVEQALAAAQSAFTNGLAEVETQVAEHTATLLQKIDSADSRVTDRMLALEARINDEQGTKMANIEATLGRIGAGFDDAMIAVNQRVLELENRIFGLDDQLHALSDAVAKIDADGIEQLKEQLSNAVGEAMLVRIELDRLVHTTDDKFDKQSVRLAEIEGQLSDHMDVGAAVQLERLDELERAVALLDPSKLASGPSALADAIPAAHTAPAAQAAPARQGLPTLTLNPRLPGTDTHHDGASYGDHAEQDTTYSSH